jgi:hypothetical protein
MDEGDGDASIGGVAVNSAFAGPEQRHRLVEPPLLGLVFLSLTGAVRHFLSVREGEAVEEIAGIGVARQRFSELGWHLEGARSTVAAERYLDRVSNAIFQSFPDRLP